MAGRTRRLRIGVLDNDSCALEYIVAMLKQPMGSENNIADVWAYTKPAQAVQECRFGQHTDILIIDMALNGLTGAQVAAEIRSISPDTGIIGITSYTPEIYEQALADAGAQALLDKSTLRSTLIDAIAAVAEGKHYPEDSAFPDVSESTETTHSAAIHLTSAEQRIITLSMGHRTSRQIADELGLPEDAFTADASIDGNTMNINMTMDVSKMGDTYANSSLDEFAQTIEDDLNATCQ